MVPIMDPIFFFKLKKKSRGGKYRGEKLRVGNLPGGKVRVWNFPGWNFQCGENSGREKCRGGINRGGTFRGEFSRGEIASHQFVLLLFVQHILPKYEHKFQIDIKNYK